MNKYETFLQKIQQLPNILLAIIIIIIIWKS